MASVSRTAEQFRVRGAAARHAHEAARAAFSDGLRDRDPVAYDRLLRTFHDAVVAALPSAAPHFMASLAQGSRQQIEAAICFLEADPWFFRSGYEKQNLIRHLKRARLDLDQRRRLGEVVVRAIDGRDRAEFRHFCRLACGVWSDALDEAVAARMESPDEGIRRRAIWVAQTVIDAGKA